MSKHYKLFIAILILIIN